MEDLESEAMERAVEKDSMPRQALAVVEEEIDAFITTIMAVLVQTE